MGEPVAVDAAVAEKTLMVLLAHAKGAALPSTPAGDTPRADVALSLLAMLAHLATASSSLRALVLERVPELRELGRAARAKHDALRAIHAELARYNLCKAATPRDERPRDAAAALNQELAGLAGWLSSGLRELETSAVPPNVMLASELAIEFHFRTALHNVGIQLCSEDEFWRAHGAASRKHLTNQLMKERFHRPRGVTYAEVAREAREAGFVTAPVCTAVCQMYDACTASMLTPTAQDAAAFPLMPQRAADTAGAWTAFERYARDRLGCQRFQSARRLLLEDARTRVEYYALRDGLRALRLDTSKKAQQSAPAKRGKLVQRAFAYVNDISAILTGGFPINDADCDVQSARNISDDEDDWSSEEEKEEEEESEESEDEESWGEAEDEDEDEED
jgi:hypothetical protein